MPQTSPENVQLPKYLLEKNQMFFSDMQKAPPEGIQIKNPTRETLQFGSTLVDYFGDGGGSSHLNGAVEEAAVLSWLVHQAFGESQRHHAPRLVGLFQTFSRLLEHLNPCFGVGTCS